MNCLRQTFLAITQHSGWLLHASKNFLHKSIVALIIILLFLMIAALVKKSILRFSKSTHPTHPGIKLVADTLRISIILIGIITALGTIGVNIAAIVASLGLTGFAIGFALKDFLTNILAGFTILIYQPYEIGNVITVPKSSSSNVDFTGKVHEINLRYTVLLTPGNERILIPNASMSQNSILIVER